MKMNFGLYDQVMLTQDISKDNLMVGDVAVLVDIVPHPSGGESGAVLEIFNAVGESISVTTVPISAIAPLQPSQMPSVRPIKTVAG